MKPATIYEYNTFCERLNFHIKEIVQELTPFVLQEHGKKERTDSVPKQIVIHVDLCDVSTVDILTREVVREGGYKVMMFILTEPDGSILCGTAMYWMWKLIEKKINLDEFPNLQIPEFTNEPNPRIKL